MIEDWKHISGKLAHGKSGVTGRFLEFQDVPQVPSRNSLMMTLLGLKPSKVALLWRIDIRFKQCNFWEYDFRNLPIWIQMIWTKFMGLNSSHPDEVVGFSRPSKVTRLNKSSSRRLEAGLPLDAVDTRRNAGVIANDLWPKGEETMRDRIVTQLLVDFTNHHVEAIQTICFSKLLWSTPLKIWSILWNFEAKTRHKWRQE